VPRSLTGRIVLVVVLPLIAAWLAMGLALTVILATLHADATKSSLADIGQTLIVRFRAAALDRELRAVVAEVREGVAGSGIEVHLLRADGSYTELDEAPGSAIPSAPIAIPPDAARGQTLSGAMEFSDGNQHLYAATVLRPANGAGPRAIVLSLQDRSRGQALGDMVKALPLMVVVGIAVGLPLTLLLVRSVGGPLRRLAAATADLPTGNGHRPLPLEGPGEIRELTARFNAMAEEIQTARAREAALLADLRHDLRTPLTVIAGYASALSDGTATGDDAIRAAQTIGEESARLERLVDELGAVERLRRGAEGLRPEPIDAIELLTDSAQRFRAAATVAGIELVVIGAADRAAADPALEFVADRGALERILANLVSNALAAAPGGHVWLSATAAPPVEGASGSPRTLPDEPPRLPGEPPPAHGGSVILAVTDDGPGFPPGAATRAFERFFRADPARAGTGSGLGLAIVREFATAHGGKAYAENVAPRGARVSVVLPRIPPAR